MLSSEVVMNEVGHFTLTIQLKFINLLTPFGDDNLFVFGVLQWFYEFKRQYSEIDPRFSRSEEEQFRKPLDFMSY